MFIEETKQWLIDFVLHHNLCPFAHHPHQQNKIRYHLSKAKVTEEQIEEFLGEILALENQEAQTTLIIYPTHFPMFLEYLDFFELLEDILEDTGWDETYQLASFHPNYQFADSDYEDPANATNRSPFPMVHLLRRADVRQAIENHPDTLNIAQRNIELLRSLNR